MWILIRIAETYFGPAETPPLQCLADSVFFVLRSEHFRSGIWKFQDVQRFPRKNTNYVLEYTRGDRWRPACFLTLLIRPVRDHIPRPGRGRGGGAIFSILALMF